MGGGRIADARRGGCGLVAGLNWPVLGRLRFGDRTEEGGENARRLKAGLRRCTGAGGRIGLLRDANLIRGGVLNFGSDGVVL